MCELSFYAVAIDRLILEPENTHLLLFIVLIQQNSWIQTIQTGGQPYIDISPYEVSECSLLELMIF